MSDIQETATRKWIKQSICNLIDNHFDQIIEVYNAQDKKIAVGFSVKLDEAKGGQKQVTTAISFVKTRITDKVIIFADDEQMQIFDEQSGDDE